MQKVVNVLAVASSVVSLAVVGSGLYVFVNRASIIDGIKSQALESILGGTGGLGGSLGGAAGGAADLGVGANDLMPSAPQATPVPDAPSAPQVSAN